LAFQAGGRSVRHEMTSNLSCAARGPGLEHGEDELSPVWPRVMERGAWDYLLCLSAFPFGLGACRPAIGRGSRQLARWDFFRRFVPFRPILSHSILLILSALNMFLAWSAIECKIVQRLKDRETPRGRQAEA
jgi:hypothetical protein